MLYNGAPEENQMVLAELMQFFYSNIALKLYNRYI